MKGEAVCLPHIHEATILFHLTRDRDECSSVQQYGICRSLQDLQFKCQSILEVNTHTQL